MKTNLKISFQNAAEYTYGAQGFGIVTGRERVENQALAAPELNCGFVPAWWYTGACLETVDVNENGVCVLPTDEVLPQDMQDRVLPLWFKADVSKGQYRITVTLFCEQDCANALLFFSRRRLVWKGSLRAGETFTYSGLCDVSPIIPRGSESVQEDTSVDVALAAPGVRLSKVCVEPADTKVIYVMGDSTVTDQSADVPYAPATSYSGWGQMLPYFTGDEWCVSNHAHSGLTTESFRKEGHYDILRQLIKKGDVVLMQFAHNDQKLAHLKAKEGYRENLVRYIEEIRSFGGEPVLVTPLARNSWSDPQNYNDLLTEYAQVVRDLAQEYKTPLVDLHCKMKQAILQVGLEDAKKWFYPCDYTHTNDFGALMAAGFVAEDLHKAGIIKQNSSWQWQQYGPVQPMTPPENTTVAPPQGVNEWEAYETVRPDEAITRVEAMEIVIRTLHFFPINVYNDLYDDVVGHETYAGTVQCAAQNHLIPADFIENNLLQPHKAVSLQDFLRMLMTGYAARGNLTPSQQKPEGVSTQALAAVQLALSAKLVQETEAWGSDLTRKQAAQICKKVKL